ncbi:YceI family protein [Flavobacterium cellulosilyticum]|uniref:YceI family protein n=1 Tax=Flavobacterium cellulosilyticum TaxID=2541731 RepID=A0A4R5CK40_9FLAO|nr:YceI family protein [Flavobacterium cellulosilyticum]TDD98723.1 YceI family protein [Flavobacterium cellulosilyticum]
MLKNKTLKYFTLLLVSVVISIQSVALAQYSPIILQWSTINVHGTSNVHDWDMKPTKIIGELGISNVKQIYALTIKIEVKSLKSGNGIMDGKTYDAFDYKKNPYVSFQLTDASQTKLTESDAEITLTGNLSFAGQTHKIAIKSIGKITKTGDYELKGSFPLKMTDFGMKPPTAMLGTMKTGDAVTIKFDVTYKG